jgi:hypothetical protein
LLAEQSEVHQRQVKELTDQHAEVLKNNQAQHNNQLNDLNETYKKAINEMPPKTEGVPDSSRNNPTLNEIERLQAKIFEAKKQSLNLV